MPDVARWHTRAMRGAPFLTRSWLVHAWTWDSALVVNLHLKRSLTPLPSQKASPTRHFKGDRVLARAGACSIVGSGITPILIPTIGRQASAHDLLLARNVVVAGTRNFGSSLHLRV